MSNKTDDCAICLEPLNNGKRTETPGVESGCHHRFHTRCIDRLFERAEDASNMPCPLCRINLVPPHMREGNYSYGGKKQYKRSLKTKGKRSLRKNKTKCKTKIRKTLKRKTMKKKK